MIGRDFLWSADGPTMSIVDPFKGIEDSITDWETQLKRIGLEGDRSGLQIQIDTLPILGATLYERSEGALLPGSFMLDIWCVFGRLYGVWFLDVRDLHAFLASQLAPLVAMAEAAQRQEMLEEKQRIEQGTRRRLAR